MDQLGGAPHADWASTLVGQAPPSALIAKPASIPHLKAQLSARTAVREASRQPAPPSARPVLRASTRRRQAHPLSLRARPVLRASTRRRQARPLSLCVRPVLRASTRRRQARPHALHVLRASTR